MGLLDTPLYCKNQELLYIITNLEMMCCNSTLDPLMIILGTVRVVWLLLLVVLSVRIYQAQKQNEVRLGKGLLYTDT